MAHNEIPPNSFTDTERAPTLILLFLPGFKPMFQNVRHCEQESVFCFRQHLDRKWVVCKQDLGCYI